jgi:predicted pyridoxine 5'-phosphate oxidase superfamily flavin-nucleotide-binding protein
MALQSAIYFKAKFMNYPELAFTPAVKALQERYGSRSSYARMENFHYTDGMTESEMEFIESQDHFYMASISGNGYPYIQYRGGPPGFLKVLDKNTLAFLDFSGNKQYITTGNLVTNNHLALFLLDQASQTRLKLFADGEVLELDSHSGLTSELTLQDYKYKPERIYRMTVKAYDWNCQQHIAPRYTLGEIEEHFEAQHGYIEQLRKENAELKAKLAKAISGT